MLSTHTYETQPLAYLPALVEVEQLLEGALSTLRSAATSAGRLEAGRLALRAADRLMEVATADLTPVELLQVEAAEEPEDLDRGPTATIRFRCPALEKTLSLGACVRQAIGNTYDPCSVQCPMAVEHARRMGVDMTSRTAEQVAQVAG